MNLDWEVDDEWRPPKRGRPKHPAHWGHGTKAGYLKHNREQKKDPTHMPCADCLAAWRKYVNERRAARRKDLQRLRRQKRRQP